MPNEHHAAAPGVGADPPPRWSVLMQAYKRALLNYRRAIDEAKRTRDLDAFAALDESFADLIDAGARVRRADRRR